MAIPFMAKKWARAEWPPRRRKRDRSCTRPIFFTSASSKREALTAHPCSEASDRHANSLQGRAQSPRSSGIRPRKATSSARALAHSAAPWL
eukprot:1678079-Pyramimonas_sp.AAC.1